MGHLAFRHDAEKTYEAILYIARHVSAPTLHTIAKIMYFADKRHLEDYGRFITGDTYIAMEYGPVPSYAYDYLKFIRQHKDASADIGVEGYHVTARREAQLDIFSPSDLECLQESVALYGQMTFGQLTDASHDEAWHNSPENGEITIETIVNTFEDAHDLLEHLRDSHP